MRETLWNRRNRRLKAKKLIGLFVILIVLIAFVNLIIRIPGWYQKINQPFGRIQSTIANDGDINDSFRTNILLLSLSERNSLQDLAIASFNSKRNSLTIVRIPISAKTYTANADLNATFSAIYFSKPYLSSDFDSLYIAAKESIALPLDGYFVFTSDDLKFTDEVVNQARGKLFSINFLFRFFSYKAWLNEHMKTNYSIAKLWSLSWDFKRISKDKLSVLDLKELAEVDNLLQESILDTNVANEGAVVEISASEDVPPGYPINLVDRVVNNLGASTINLGKVDESSETKVVLDSDKNKVAERLAKFLSIKVEKEKIESGADVKVIVGEDFDRIFYGE